MDIEREMVTPPQLAKLWGTDVKKILRWIKTEELRAYNFATDKRGRPQYRINLSDAEAFKQARLQCQATVPRSKPAKRLKAVNVPRLNYLIKV